MEQRTPLVGRESELTQLQHLFEKALKAQRQVVFVTGEAGIGKTTLVDAFLTQIRNHADVRITSGQCVEQYGPGEAYLPLLEATARLCRAPGGERRIAALQRYAPSWLAQLPSLLAPHEFDRLQQRAQGMSRERMLREMAEAAEGFAATRTLVLVLEDLHWSDVSTLDWVTYVARRREPARLLILGTYRPADVLASKHPLRGVVQELWARGQCEELRLAPLAEEAIAEYLAVRLNANGEARRVALPRLIPVLHHRTGGNPLFLVNTVDDLIRQGVFAEEGGPQILRIDAVKVISEGIPDTLRQLVERQLERLPEAERRLLEVASTAGVEFAAAEVAAGLLTEQDNIEATCERLARMGQWLRAAGTAEWPDGTISGRYSFLHAVHQEVVYAQVTEVRRARLHRRIAERKEAAYGERVGEIAAELAVHFERGRELTQAVQYLDKAGETAVRRGAHQEAISHLTKGLNVLTTFPETPEHAPQELRLYLTLGTSLMATKGYATPELERIYARAQELCQQLQETPQLLSVLGGLWVFYATRARLQTALELAEQYLAVAGTRQRPTPFLWAHCFMGQTLYGLGRLRESRTHLERSLRFYDPQKHNPRVTTAPQDPGETSLAYLARVLWLLGYPEQALEKSGEACNLAQNLAHPYSLAHALSLSASLHQLRGEAPAAQKQAEAAITLLNESGSPYRLAQGTILWGWTLAEQGMQEEGISQILQGLAAWQASGAELWRPYYLSLLTEVHIKANQLEKGRQIVAEALQLIETTEEHVYDAELYRLYGEVLLQMGERDQRDEKTSSHVPATLPGFPSSSEKCFQKALEIARGQEAKSWELRAAMSLARLWRQQNKVTEARELLEEIYGWFTEGFDTKDLQEAAALLRELGYTEERQKTKGKRQKSELAGDYKPKAERLSPSSPLRLRPAASSLAERSAPNTQPSPSPTPPSQLLASNLFRCEGGYWTLSFAGRTCRLKKARGLHYIAHLLQHPHQEVHVVTLITVGTDFSEGLAEVRPFQDLSLPFNHTEKFSDAGEIFDPQARATYKQRLAELQRELAEAQAFHDLGRSEQLIAQLDFLIHELTRAVGLGEQGRRGEAPTERARVNITRAIKLALRKIAKHHPPLGQHLAVTIKTGVYCSYTPDPRLPITWQR